MFLEFVNENLWLFVALALVVNLLLWTMLQGVVQGANVVSALEMPALQRKGKSIIVDVNNPSEYASSHIPNSTNYSLEELVAANNSELLKHKDNTIILVCQSGSRSTKAAKALVKQGFNDVNILRGGLLAWAKENLPLKSSAN